jgi:hypothetical protein
VPVIDNNWILHRGIVVLENEAGKFSTNRCVFVQVNWRLTLSRAAHAAPIFVI